MKLDSNQQALVQEVANQRVLERDAIAKAEADLRTAKLAARRSTNAAVHAAWRGGVSKARITRDGLGLSSPLATDDRLREYAEHVGAEAPEAGPVVEIITERTTVFVTKTDDGYTVRLDGFSHPDVGNDLTGTYQFDNEGDPLDDDTDPMFALRLWGTTAVQEGVENA